MPMAEYGPVDTAIDQDASVRYWSHLPPTTSSMLGVVGTLPWYTRNDLQGSKRFLKKARRMLSFTSPIHLGVDCGAGVGRVTEGFLSKVCDMVDIVEPVDKFLQVVRQGELAKEGKIGDIFNVGLEKWTPKKKYGLIWVQWCAGHLTDAQLHEFLIQCKGALTDQGFLVFKENLATGFMDEYDNEDSSVTRVDEKFLQLFADAGFSVILSEIQSGIPPSMNMLPVKSYALRPAS